MKRRWTICRCLGIFLVAAEHFGRVNSFSTASHQQLRPPFQKCSRHHFRDHLKTFSPNLEQVVCSDSSLFGFRSSVRETISYWNPMRQKRRQQQLSHRQTVSTSSSVTCGVPTSSPLTEGQQQIVYEETTPETIAAEHDLLLAKEEEEESELESSSDITEMATSTETADIAAATVDTLSPPPTSPSFQPTSPLFVLPPVELSRRASLTPREQEFRQILTDFANCTTREDIQATVDPRERIILEGITAAATNDAVYRAFEVLFEDLYPLRVAGRSTFRRMRVRLDAERKERRAQVEAVLAEIPTLPVDAVEELRRCFVATAAQLNRDRIKENYPSSFFLTLEQLSEMTSLNQITTSVRGLNSTDNDVWRDRLNAVADDQGRVTFVGLMVALKQYSEDVCGATTAAAEATEAMGGNVEKTLCDGEQILQNMIAELSARPFAAVDLPSHLHPSSNTAKQNRRQQQREQHVAKYDAMTTTFLKWNELIAPVTNNIDEAFASPQLNTKGRGEGRRLDVVRGCFAGASCPAVLAALRVIYCDYAPLRVAGDLIFALCQRFMAGRQQQSSSIIGNGASE